MAARSRVTSLTLVLLLVADVALADAGPTPTVPSPERAAALVAPLTLVADAAPAEAVATAASPPRPGRIMQIIGLAVTAYGAISLLVDVATTLIFTYTSAKDAIPTKCSDGRNPCPYEIANVIVNVAGYVSLGISALALGIGITLVILGTVKNKNAAPAAPAAVGPSARLVFAPTVNGGGLKLALDF